MSILAIPKELLWADILPYLYIAMMSVLCCKLLHHRCVCVCVNLSYSLGAVSCPNQQLAFNQKGRTPQAAATALKLSTFQSNHYQRLH